MPKKTNFEVNGKNYYRVSVTIGYDSAGTRLRKVFYGSSRKEAEAKRNEYLDGLKRGLDIDYDKITFGEFFIEWLYVVKKPTVSLSSFSRYDSIWRIHIKDVPFYKTPIIKIKSIDVQKYYNGLNEEHGANLVDRVHLLVSGFFKYCLAERVINRNPATNVKRPVIKKDTTKKTFLSKEDIKKLVPLFALYPNAFIFQFALNTGMRPGEILALTHEDINIESRNIRINKSVKRVTVVDGQGNRQTELITSAPKTQSGNRVLPIGNTLIEPLHKHIKHEKEKHLKLGVPFYPQHYFFSSATCITPLRNDHLTVRWKKLQKDHGIEPVDFKGLRHTFCSLLADQNVPLKTAMTLMGHSDPKQILKIYAHAYEDKKVAAIEGLSEYQ